MSQKSFDDVIIPFKCFIRKDFEKNFNDAIAELQQSFEVELTIIPLNDFVEYLGKLPNEYTFNNIMVFEKLLV